MVEPLLSGIVLGMITVSAFGLFVAAYLQYRRLQTVCSISLCTAPLHLKETEVHCNRPGGILAISKFNN